MKKLFLFIMTSILLCSSASAITISNVNSTIVCDPTYNVSSVTISSQNSYYYEGIRREVNNWSNTYTVSPHSNIYHNFSFKDGTLTSMGIDDMFSYAKQSARDYLDSIVNPILSQYNNYITITGYQVSTSGINLVADNTSARINYLGETAISFVDNKFDIGKTVYLTQTSRDNSTAGASAWSNSSGTKSGYQATVYLNLSIGWSHKYTTRYCSVGSLQNLTDEEVYT